MDIVLELFDTVAFDYLYAATLPVKSTAQLVSSLPASGLNATQATQAGHNGYVYNPASVYLQMEPSKYAYLSAVTRDNPYRQGFTLFLITWYAKNSPSLSLVPLLLVSTLLASTF